VPSYLEIPLADDEVLLVDITSQEVGLSPAGGREVRERLAGALQESLGRVRMFAGQVLEQLRSTAEPPDKVGVEFGLKLTAKTGVVIAESTSEAHITVTLEWQRSQPSADSTVATGGSAPAGRDPAPGPLRNDASSADPGTS